MARRVGVWVLFVGVLATRAQGGIIISLEARDSQGAALGTQVPPGTVAQVDILLSLDAGSEPVANLRGIGFNFTATDPSIVVIRFEWRVGSDAYGFQLSELPSPAAVATLMAESPILIELTTSPVPVATVFIMIGSNGTLDVVNPSTTDPNEGAWFRTGFGPAGDPIVNYSLFDGNLRGGSLEFVVGDVIPPPDPDSSDPDSPEPPLGDESGPPPTTNDFDGDGVLNRYDAYPFDPDEFADEDGNGIGDNADRDAAGDESHEQVDGDGVGDESDSPSPRPRMCGFGMLFPSMLILAVLNVVGFRRRHRPII